LPSGIGYTLIRIPFLISDLIFLKIFVQKFRETNNSKALYFYLLSPVILFHQYYSGQFDLITVLPFFIAVIAFEKNLLNRSALFLFISLALKPFGIIFYPLLALKKIKISKANLQFLFLLFLTIVFYKLSELPFSLSKSYRVLMGAGSDSLVKNVFFLALYILIIGVMFLDCLSKNQLWTIPEGIVVIMLAMAATTNHSAGWMTWIIPFVTILMFNKEKSCETPLWYLWGTLFVLRWSLVEHSPLLDSFSVFFDKFLVSDLNLPMGAPYHWISKSYGDAVAKVLIESSRILFSITSFLIMVRIFFVKEMIREKKFFLSKSNKLKIAVKKFYLNHQRILLSAAVFLIILFSRVLHIKLFAVDMPWSDQWDGEIERIYLS